MLMYDNTEIRTHTFDRCFPANGRCSQCYRWNSVDTVHDLYLGENYSTDTAYALYLVENYSIDTAYALYLVEIYSIDTAYAL